MEEINWDRIDKRKFFTQGAGLFSGVTCMLFPLSVIKTRQMASHSSKGMKATVSNIWRNEGIPGFYRGFTTVIFGTIPARMVYLAALEVVKDGTTKLGHRMHLDPTTTAGLANFAGGAAASLSIQLVTVPIDVVSQRQMVHGTDTSSREAAAGPSTSSQPAGGSSTAGQATSQQHKQYHSASAAAGTQHIQGVRQGQGQQLVGQGRGRVKLGGQSMSWHGLRQCTAASAAAQHVSGLSVARMILKEEGVKGFYRGFGMSVATFVPSSAMWWAAYGVYQRVVSQAYVKYIIQSHQQQQQPEVAAASRSEPSAGQTHTHSSPAGSAVASQGHTHALSRQEVLSLQLMSSLLAGGTASLLTNPLDLIKTRIQVAVKGENQTSVRAVLEEILREDGAAGLLRGALPRMVNSAMWGSCMVMVYEFLKRISMKDE